MTYIFIFYLLSLGLFLTNRYVKLNNNRLCLEKFTYLVIGFFYIVIPFFYLIYFDSLKENTYNFWVLKTENDFESLSYAFIIYCISMTFLLFGISLGKKIKVKNVVLSKENVKFFKWFVYFFGIISIAITLLYIYRVGGLVQAIVDANLYRAHGLKEPPVGQLAKFQPLIINAALLIFALNGRFKYVFLIFAIVYLLLEASRTNFGLFMIILYLFHVNKYRKFSLAKLVIPFSVAIFMAYVGNSITNYIESGEWVLGSGIFYSVISQFSPTFSNVMNSHNFVDLFGFGYFEDALSIFPQTLFGLEKTTKTWEYLTEYYLGGFFTVGIPIDLFSYSYSQFGFFGSLSMPLFFGFFLGYIIKKLNYMILTCQPKDRDLILMIELVFSMFIMALINWASLDSTVFYGSLKYWIFLLMFFIILRLRKRDAYITR